MECKGCDGKGFKEYDAGLLVIGCVECSGIGKVDCKLTKEEFEQGYAFRSDMTVAQIVELGLEAVANDCVEGWAMERVPTQELETIPSKTLDETEEIARKLALGALLEAGDMTGYADVEGVYHVESAKEVSHDNTPSLERIITGPLEGGYPIAGVANDSASGTGQPDSNTGSGDTGEPTKPKKPKAKKRARKKAG